MTNLLQFKGKNDYFHIGSPKDFGAFVEECEQQGITRFSSGKAINSDEFHNHDDVYVKVKGDGTLAFVNYQGKVDSRVHEYVSNRPVVSQQKATRPSVISSSYKNEKETKGMKNSKFGDIFKSMGFDLTKTDDFGIDLMTGKLAYISNGKATIIDGKRDLTDTLVDMIKVIPLMCIPTAIDQIKIDDIIKVKNTFGVVTKVDGAQIQIQNYSGTVSNQTIAKHVLTGTGFVPKLFNPFEGFGGDATTGQLNPLMMFLFMDKDGDDDLLSTFMLMQAMNGGFGGGAQVGSILPLLLMKDGGKDDILTLMMLTGGLAGGGESPFGANPMLPLLLMKDGGIGGGSTLETFALMSAFGGGGANPFAGMFAGTKAPKKAAPKKDAE